ncbi:hypothetical protein [Polaromonas sp.]|jgi:hypothetical protein|uniref:hypothetical protein n=1 Tax=Polaromonas sp. TaxID=1869339 RepID=UPI001DB4314C|nr:hypothetical protein [Polaromonas sp.]MBT9474806.1 hypothetical protein [Polaromonas sp.]
MNSLSDPTPQERLASSRRAILRHMTRDRQSLDDPTGPDTGERMESGAGSGGKWGVFKHAVRAWWHHHPVHVALDVATPVIGRYAAEKPFKLLAIAAGVGAATVVLRPWRLVSLGGLLLATLRSSELSNVVLSVLYSAPRDAEQPQETP